MMMVYKFDNEPDNEFQIFGSVSFSIGEPFENIVLNHEEYSQWSAVQCKMHHGVYMQYQKAIYITLQRMEYVHKYIYKYRICMYNLYKA
jgi:hypothetical protein